MCRWCYPAENNLAAMDTGKIWSGGELRHKRDQHFARRRRLQSNGSRSAKQLPRKVSGKERRDMRHVNHRISKEIAAEAKRVGARACGMGIPPTSETASKRACGYGRGCTAGRFGRCRISRDTSSPTSASPRSEPIRHTPVRMLHRRRAGYSAQASLQMLARPPVSQYVNSIGSPPVAGSVSRW